MRKFFVDENMTPDLVAPVTTIYRTALQVRTADQEHLRGVDDAVLFQDLHLRHFDAIITFDRHQLVHDHEREALRRASLHWIGVPPLRAKGTHALALLVAIVVPGVQHVLDDWRNVPSIYRLTGADNPAAVQPTIEPL